MMFKLTLTFLYILIHLFNRTFARPRPELLPARDACGRFIQSRIIGGDEARIGEFPWMALLEYRKDNSSSFKCGGVLINDRYVLTAAHCVDDTLFSVRLGEHNVKTAVDCDVAIERYCAPLAIDIQVKKKVVHEHYNADDMLSDIALLRLKHKVSQTDFIKPICLPLSSELRNNTFEGVIATVAGWGKTEYNIRSDVKLKVKVPIVSNRNCSQSYLKHRITIRKEQLCAGGVEGENSCNGDSGGPLMYLNSIDYDYCWMCIGIVSFGLNKCALGNLPAVYTRVTEYMPWILERLRP